MNILSCACNEQWRPAGLFVLRLTVGAVFLVHGVQKLTGLEQIGGFFGSLGIPAPAFFAIFIAILETIGGIGLITGILTHWLSKLLIADMFTALFLVHLPNGFLVSNGGYEFVLVLAGSLFAILTLGPGSWVIQKTKPAQTPQQNI